MKRITCVGVFMALCILGTGVAHAQKSDAELIAEAESAAPLAVTQNAAIKTMDGKMLRPGSSGWTCYPGTSAIGPMCNRPQWDAVLGAFMKREPIDVEEFSISYMLAGEGDLAIDNRNSKECIATVPRSFLQTRRRLVPLRPVELLRHWPPPVEEAKRNPTERRGSMRPFLREIGRAAQSA